MHCRNFHFHLAFIQYLYSVLFVFLGKDAYELYKVGRRQLAILVLVQLYATINVFSFLFFHHLVKINKSEKSDYAKEVNGKCM